MIFNYMKYCSYHILVQERAVADRDPIAAAKLEEAVQLWTNMWEADAEHDQTIVNNVRSLQSRCASMLVKLRGEIDLLPGSALPDEVNTFSRFSSSRNFHHIKAILHLS